MAIANPTMQMRDMAFLGYSLSDNISETPEGFLICHNVPIARTGIQKYFGQEVGRKDMYDKEICVHRLPQDVFDKKTLMSFEGKPVTDDHPSQAVTSHNASVYLKGHAQNIRPEGNYIIGDLLIVDALLIGDIKSGKREVSAGYTCEYEPYADGLRQFNIRANHIAIVSRGRAGPLVAIKDSISNITPKRRKSMSKKTVLADMIKAYAKDASPEELAEAMELCTTFGKEKPETTSDNEGFMKLFGLLARDKKSKSKDSDMEEEKELNEEGEEEGKETAEDRLAKLEKDTADIKRLLVKDKKKPKSVKDKFASFIADADEEDPEKEMEDCDPDCEKEHEHHFSKDAETDPSDKEEEEEEEEREVTKAETEDSIRSIARKLAPAIAKLPPNAQQVMKDALLGMRRSSVYAGISKVTKNNRNNPDRRPVSDNAPVHNTNDKHADLGAAIAKKYNPHYADSKQPINLFK